MYLLLVYIVKLLGFGVINWKLCCCFCCFSYVCVVCCWSFYYCFFFILFVFVWCFVFIIMLLCLLLWVIIGLVCSWKLSLRLFVSCGLNGLVLIRNRECCNNGGIVESIKKLLCVFLWNRNWCNFCFGKSCYNYWWLV